MSDKNQDAQIVGKIQKKETGPGGFILILFRISCDNSTAKYSKVD
jgi:hypothetical protein